MRKTLIAGGAAAALVAAGAAGITGGRAVLQQAGFLQSGVGAALRTAEDKLRDTISVKDFGAKGDGTTDDRTAIATALSAGAGRVFFPAGTYKVGSSFAVPSNTLLVGAGQSVTTIKRAFTGDFITSLGSQSGFYDLTIDGDTGTVGAGRGVLIATSTINQIIVNTTIKNFSTAALEFAADGGSGFSSVASTYYTTGAQGSIAAVKVTGTDSAAVPRKFFATESSGCTLFDFGGANNFYAGGFYTNGLIFGAASSKVFLTGMRLGSLGGTITVQGGDHILSGISAVALTNSAASSFIDVQTPSWSITDSGTNNSISQVNPSYAISWTGTTTNPTLGNGTLATRYSRSGAWIRAQVDLTIGSTTTLGSGTWEFSLPQADLSSGAVQICGSAMISNNAGSSGFIGVVRVQPGGQKVRVYVPTVSAGALQNQLTSVTNALPLAWGAGDVLRFDCEYRVP